MNCEKCDCKIPKARLEALPETTFCVKCSDVKKHKGFIDGSDDLFVVEEDVFKRAQKMQRSIKGGSF